MENLEVARRAFVDLRERRFAGGVWDPGVEVVHEGLRRWWEDLAEAFGDFDIAFDGRWASILWIKGGMVVRAQGFLSKGRAMRAAGT